MLPDITVLGQYTYLVTELMWAMVAIVLVTYADAARATARTIAVLYPFAYCWDWYTLQTGVFAIPHRTGIELLGIPLEEHLFMLVVPAMVVGAHESLRQLLDPPATDDSEPPRSGT
ncbi:MAG: lycopene cyclase domain-containing protein [Halorientalis sp.]